MTKKAPKNTEKEVKSDKVLPLYTLSGLINDIPFNVETDDIYETIKSLAPELILCDTYMTLSKGEGEDKIVNEQRLNFTQSKRVFRDDISREIFVNNLLLPFN